MRVIVAPDSFKGSISARDICTAVKEGILNVFPEAVVTAVPLADGGEGTMENMVYSSNGKIQSVIVRGPIGEDVTAAYGILGDGQTVVVEMAQASGLPLVNPEKRNPLKTTSFGTGELIKHALDAGYRKFLIGLGGSATNDCGMGMLAALGMKFFDKKGEILPEGGGSLNDLAYYDDSELDERLKASFFTIASDVSNELCGPVGASAVFGPQKGATPEMVKHLDQALSHFSEVVIKQKGIDMREMIGGGAAGGMGAALMTFLGAAVKSGIEVVMEEIQFDALLKDADLVITGEGKLDSQTLSGKVIAGVCKEAKKYTVPVIAFCGGLELEPSQFNELGILSAISIVPGPCSLEESMKNSPEWITQRIESVMRVISYYQINGLNREAVSS